jgi:ABC-type transport system substrate-binding protein
MRGHRIGTGPFKFGDFKPNEYIKVMRNPDYWKKGRPYLDGSNIRLPAIGRRQSWPSSLAITI